MAFNLTGLIPMLVHGTNNEPHFSVGNPFVDLRNGDLDVGGVPAAIGD
jgi:hypothetical protein